MRAYFFGNMYFSGIHAGIQSLHTVVEMYNKYPVGSQQYSVLNHWALEHKTVVLLTGGYSQELRSLITFFNTTENSLPWAHFNESDEACDGALTSVGIILPEAIYEAAKAARTIDGSSTLIWANGYIPKKWEIEMAARLNNYGLAR